MVMNTGNAHVGFSREHWQSGCYRTREKVGNNEKGNCEGETGQILDQIFMIFD